MGAIFFTTSLMMPILSAMRSRGPEFLGCGRGAGAVPVRSEPGTWSESFARQTQIFPSRWLQFVVFRAGNAGAHNCCQLHERRYRRQRAEGERCEKE
jgi:hypothetical protein